MDHVKDELGSISKLQLWHLKMDSYYISLLSERKSIFKYPKAIINGFISNLRARKTFNYSSLIFILQKEKQ